LGIGRPADLSPHSSRHSFEGLEAALEQEAGVAEAQILPGRSTEDYIHIENVETTSIRPPKKSKARYNAWQRKDPGEEFFTLVGAR